MSIFLTAAGFYVLSALGTACAPVVNDWSNRKVAPPTSYQTTNAVGASAGDLLAGNSFKQIVVETQSIRGFAPTAEALSHLQKFLSDRLNKPGGVVITQDSDIAPTTTATAPNITYSVPDAQRFELRHRNHFPLKDRLTVYLVFLDGASSEDHADIKTLGQAYANTSILIFENTLRTEAAKNAGVPLWLVEATVIEHEFGHLLGLVNAPTADQAHHEDPAHPGHCLTSTSSSLCLMNFAADTAAIIPALIGTQPLALDANCLQDLKSAGGK